MLLLMRYGCGLFLFLSLVLGLSGPGFSQEKLNSSKRKSRSETASVVIDLGLGLAQFDALVMPSENELVQNRGVFSEETVSTHKGLAVNIGTGYVWRAPWLQSKLSGNYMKVLEVASAAENTATSSYSQFNLGLLESLTVWGRGLYPALGADLRRTSFISSGDAHVADSVLVRFGLRSKISRIEMGLFAYQSVYSKYGLMRGNGLKKQDLGDVSSKVTGVDFEGLMGLNRLSKFLLSYRWEKTEMTIKDVRRYNDYGLDVIDFPVSRSYALNTHIFRFGLIKTF